MPGVLTEEELTLIREDALRYPECIECRTIIHLLDEVYRLVDEQDHWVKRATFAEQFIPAQE